MEGMLSEGFVEDEEEESAELPVGQPIKLGMNWQGSMATCCLGQVRCQWMSELTSRCPVKERGTKITDR